MPQLVIPEICRFAMFGTAGRPWVNILDFKIDPDVFESCHDAIADQASVINEEVPTRLDNFCSTGWIYQGVRWVDLNTADGETGSSTETSGALVLPAPGAVAGERFASSLTYLINKNVSSGRGKRKGRMYFGSMAEVEASAGTVIAGTVTAMNTALAGLKTALNQNSKALSVGSYNSALVVVHTPAGEDPSYDVVQSLTVQPTLAHQRRRLRP